MKFNYFLLAALSLLIVNCKGQDPINPPPVDEKKFAYIISGFNSTYPSNYANGGIFLDGGAPWTKDGDSVYYIGYEPGQAYGNYKTPAYEFNWTVYKGTDMDHLTLWKKWRPKLNGDWPMPAGDEAFWPAGLWVDSNGDWYTTVHIEFNYNKGFTTEFKPWFRRIGAAKSTDKGSSWTYLGDIVTSDNPTDNTSSFLGNYIDIGPGDQNLLVHNGYFYVIYDHVWQKKAGSSVSINIARGTRMARCAITDKMAHGKWSKWYNGTWSQPGLRGFDSNISYAGDRITNISYNSYLKKYLAIGVYNFSTITVSTSSNLENINFSSPMKLADNTSDWGWYNSVWDSQNGSSMITGQTFRIYTGQASTFSIKYATLTLNDPGIALPVNVVPVYPSEPVNDHNLGY